MNASTLASRIQRRLRRTFWSPRTAARLSKSNNLRLAAVGRALVAVIRRQQDPAMEQIEKRRASLQESKEVVEVPDYGAGSPDDTRSAEDMLAGRMVQEVVGEACMNYSKEPLWAELLFHLVRQMRPLSGIEMGACMGISGAYQAAAMKANGTGKLISMEGSPSFAKIASQTLESVGLAACASVVVGRFTDTLPGVLEKATPVDYCFIDGHHDEHATLAYFDQVMPHTSAEATLVFDDIRWSPGMFRAWERIRSDRRVTSSFDCGKCGICLTGGSPGGHHRFVLE